MNHGGNNRMDVNFMGNSLYVSVTVANDFLRIGDILYYMSNVQMLLFTYIL